MRDAKGAQIYEGTNQIHRPDRRPAADRGGAAGRLTGGYTARKQHRLSQRRVPLEKSRGYHHELLFRPVSVEIGLCEYPGLYSSIRPGLGTALPPDVDACRGERRPARASWNRGDRLRAADHSRRVPRELTGRPGAPHREAQPGQGGAALEAAARPAPDGRPGAGEARPRWRSITYTRDVGLGHAGRDGPQAPRHQRWRPGLHHVAHPSRMAHRGHRRHVTWGPSPARSTPRRSRARRRTSSTTSEATAIFVENPQQSAKIEKVRAECPTARADHPHRGARRAAARAVSFDDIFDLVGRGARRDPRVGGALARLRPREGRHHRPHLRHDRQPEGRGADPRQHRSTTSRRPSRPSTSTRATSSSRSCRYRT